MTPCDGKKGCKAEGKWAIKINVPATGWAIDLHQPLVAIVDLALCDACFAKTTLDSILGPQLMEIFHVQARCATIASGGDPQRAVPPDFARAWLSKVSINSNEVRLTRRGKETLQ